MNPEEELTALGAFYGVPVDEVVARHGAALRRYSEWVLGRTSLAVVTLGDVQTLAPLGSPTAAARFAGAAARWPHAHTGVKLAAAPASAPRQEPTLYVRCVCPWDEALAWLHDQVGAAAAQIPRSRTLYGFGFQGAIIKTYALVNGGFVSWRLDDNGVRREHKDYRADVDWAAIDWPDAQWAAVGALGRRLGFQTAGHVGWDSAAHEQKIYVERVGGIVTDRSLA